MLATKVTRAAQRLSSSNSINAATCSPYLASQPTRSKHQRRRSSSKASCPPDNSKPTSAAVTPPATADAQPLRTKRSAKTRRLVQEKAIPADSSYNALPFVPQLNGLADADFGLSKFFALHRPLAVSKPIPTTISDEAFNAIFEAKPEESDPWADGNSAERRPEDVIYALSTTIQNMDEAAAAAQGELYRAEATEETKHLDSTPQLKLPSLADLVNQYKPYQVPPPPEPFTTSTPITEKKRSSRPSKTAAPKTKSYTTTITLVESEGADGVKTLKASVTPLVRVPDAVPAWTSYRGRRRQPAMMFDIARQMIRRRAMREPRARRVLLPTPGKPTMMLISVKRQRRLKMKKHKYKKLMRRTRNLRRRIENK